MHTTKDQVYTGKLFENGIHQMTPEGEPALHRNFSVKPFCTKAIEKKDIKTEEDQEKKLEPKSFRQKVPKHKDFHEIQEKSCAISLSKKKKLYKTNMKYLKKLKSQIIKLTKKCSKAKKKKRVSQIIGKEKEII